MRNSVRWDSVVTKSILKHHRARPEARWAQQWLTNTGRHVRFSIRTDSPDSLDDDSNDDDDEHIRAEHKLPVLSLPDEDVHISKESSASISRGEPDEKQRLPPLQMIPSTDLALAISQSAGQPSWVERQVAKVKQRKLWAQQTKSVVPKHPTRILKRTVSLLVNVSDDCDTDSLDGDGRPAQLPDQGISHRRPLAWDVMLDREEGNNNKNEEAKDPPTITEPYGGWAHFPPKLAGRIEERQKVLNERKAGRNEKKKGTEVTGQSINAFARRKIFSKSLLMAVIRLRNRRAAKRAALRSIRSAPSQVADLTAESPPPPLSLLPNIAEEMDAAPKSTRRVDDNLATVHPPSEPEDLEPPAESIASQSPAEEEKSGSITINPVSEKEDPPQITYSDDPAAMEQSFLVSLVVSASCDVQLDGAPVDENPAIISTRMDEADATQSIRQEEEEAEKVTATVQCHRDDDMFPPPSSDLTADGNDAAAPSRLPISIWCCPSFLEKGNSADDDESISRASSSHHRFDEGNREMVMSNVIPSPIDSKSHSAGRFGIDPPRPVFGEEDEPAVPSHLSGNLEEEDPIAEADSATVSSATGAQSGQDATPDSIPISKPVTSPVSSSALFKREEDGRCLFNPDLVASESPVSGPVMAATAPISNHQIPSASDHFEDQTSDKAQEEDCWPADLLDKKSKESRNASRLYSVTMWTQTEPLTFAGQEETDKYVKGLETVVKSVASRSSSAGSSKSDVAASKPPDECRCLHRAVLGCLLPEATETLANLELIRRQLKRARLRRQDAQQQHSRDSKLQTQQKRVPLQARVSPSEEHPA